MIYVLQVIFFWIFAIAGVVGTVIGFSSAMSGAIIGIARPDIVDIDPSGKEERWMKRGIAVMLIGAAGAFLVSPYWSAFGML